MSGASRAFALSADELGFLAMKEPVWNFTFAAMT